MSLHCTVCDSAVPAGAPYCPACGSDPILGLPWPETATLPRDDDGDVRLYDAAELATVSADELSQSAIHCAWCIGLLESAAASLLTSEPGRLRVFARRRYRRQAPAQFLELQLRVGHLVDGLRLALDALIGRSKEEGLGYEEFAAAHPAAVWAGTHLDAYLSAEGVTELVDVLRRRVGAVIGRQGADMPLTAAAESGRYQLVFNGWLLQRRHDAIDEIEQDPVIAAAEGELVDVLVPAAWRYWNDVSMAPVVAVLVHTVPSPAAGLGVADPAWEGDRRIACRAYRAYVSERAVRDVEVEACEVGGLPAVRATGVLVADDAVAAVEYLWVNAGDCIFYVHTAAPQAAPEYAQAVHDALESFKVAA